MERKKLLTIRHLDVKFNVRARILSAIRDITMEIYEGENIAIVGESGSGKSVLTKTFTGMLESNGVISHGKIIYHNKELEDTNVHVDPLDVYFYNQIKKELLEALKSCTSEEAKNLNTPERLNTLAVDLMCSIDRFPFFKKFGAFFKLKKIFSQAIKDNILLTDKKIDRLIAKVTFKVSPVDKNYVLPIKGDNIKAVCTIDLAKIKLNKDWQKIRGVRIATVFQDPMTSLNPIRSIGSQITEVIIKHRGLSNEEAKKEAISLMEKVGIVDAAKRFNEYSFQYSGGMRQRIVIAIALACRPQILICDEPTTALDVTIQAQIIQLIKDLQKEFGFTTIYITHDLGVVASVADRVAVIYAGQIIEIGKVEEIYYEPKHPYTWALLSSLPQLSEKGSELFSIKGTPPSLYNEVKGDAFAPRNPYALKIDFVEEPPMFEVTPTHFAKTWLLDPRAPKIESPKIIHDLHIKMAAKANLEGVMDDVK